MGPAPSGIKLKKALEISIEKKSNRNDKKRNKK